MATYFVASSGSNTAPYDTWAKAATSLATALAAATADNDIIVLDVAGVPSGDAEVSGTTTWTFAGNVALICSTNTGTATITPTAMGETYWIGNSTTTRALTLAGAKRVFIYGLTVRQHGTSSISVNASDGGHFELENCLLWQSITNSVSTFVIGGAANHFTKFSSSTIKSARTASSDTRCTVNGNVVFENTTFTWATTTSVALFMTSAASSSLVLSAIGCDFSSLGSSALVGDNSRQAASFTFTQCKLGASAVILATQSTVPNKSSASALVLDCSSGDTHGLFGYYDALGSVVSDQGIYFTSGAAAQSWKITTTANASYYTPFETPSIGLYNSTLSSITPYLEILRDGSATAYQDDEIWVDILAKTTSGSTKAIAYSDRMAVAGTAANQDSGAGLGSWTGESGTAWSGKIGLGSGITPAELGYISAKIYVGEPSITVYVDPQIRT